ncbi:MAG: PKD domain-containing protein, partial [Myxococcota bacterium]|nr:PKD domain-containing protein [Myxococcota bacterium]
GEGAEAEADADAEARDEGGGEAYEPPAAVIAVDPARIPRDDAHATAVTLDGTGSTGGGLSFEWTVPDGTFVEGTGPSDAVARVTFPGTADHELLLHVTNAFGTATALGTVRANRVPRADAGAGAEVAVGATARLDGAASTDPDGDPLTFSWTIAARPAGSSADLAGADTATPSLAPDAAGAYEIELVVADGLNASSPATVRVVAVPPERDPPVVRLTATPPAVPVGSTVRVCASATDASGVAAIEVEVNGSPLTLGAGGCTDYRVGAVARYEAVARARDVWDNEGAASVVFYGRSGADNGPPTVALASPADGSRLEAPADVRGTAQDTDLVLYRLAASLPGARTWVGFAEGRTSVSGGTLGRIDPGAFAPGMYEVRLCAEDSWGHVACTAPVVWDLAGAARPGTVRLAFTDATVELLGLPLAVRRVYDSRRTATSGDFGFGWTMEVAGAGTFEESNPPGEGWTYSGCSGLPFRPVLAERQSHVYTVRLADRAYRFRFAPTGRACGGGFAEVVPGFAALPGTTATLSAPGFEGTPDWIILAGGSEILDWGFDVYRPTRFVMTRADGYRYDLEVGRGVTRVTDPVGRWLSVSAGRLEHSSGVALGTPRDAGGRVTSLRRPDGATRTYRYDARGDLAATTDFGGYETRYEYDAAHRLLRIIDPRGGVPGMTEYDSEGRLVAIVDASGRRITFSHDPAARQEVITDRLGNVTVLYYDDRGNVTRRVDALGHEWNYAYDASGNLLGETNPTGATTRYEYDAGGNRTALVDPLGNRWTTTYDAGGRMLSEVDPLGNTQRYEYDAAGNVTAVVSAGGARTTYGYDAAGALVRVDLPEGGGFDLTADAAGRPTSIADDLGRTTVLAYSANGDVTSDGHPVEVGGATVTATHRYTYDPRGALTRVQGPDGAAATVTYDAAGYPVGTTAPHGAGQTVEYNALGRVSAITMPDGARVDLRYDPEDRPTSALLPGGASLNATLDPLGRPTEVALPGGGTVQYRYDPAGRLTQVRGPLGTGTSYTYDAAGRVSGTTRPDGTTLSFSRDAAGRVTGASDSGGGAVGYAYDAEGHLTGLTTAEGGTLVVTYDAGGRPTSARDATGRTLAFSYDRAGRLGSVTDALRGVSRYEYDVGNRLEQVTTPGGVVTSYSYDIAGRLLQRSGGPLDAPVTFSYDAAGRPVREADATGGTVDVTYEDAGRVTERRGSDGSGETRTYGAGGRLRTVTDAAGATVHLYDAA